MRVYKLPKHVYDKLSPTPSAPNQLLLSFVSLKLNKYHPQHSHSSVLSTLAGALSIADGEF